MQFNIEYNYELECERNTTACTDAISVALSALTTGALLGICLQTFHNNNENIDNCINWGFFGYYYSLSYNYLKKSVLNVKDQIGNSFFKLKELYHYGDTSNRDFLERQKTLIDLLPDSLPAPEIHFTETQLRKLDEPETYEQGIEEIYQILKVKLPGTSFLKAQNKLDRYFKLLRLYPVNKFNDYDLGSESYILKVIVYDTNWRYDNKPNKNTVILDVLEN